MRIPRWTLLTLLLAAPLAAEVHTLSLRRTLERALELSPEVALARLEEGKAAQGVRLARDPFLPKVYAGSGLAYSHGFPMSIEGAAPSVIQARGVAAVFDRAQSHRLAQARENARTSALDTATRRDAVGLEAVSLHLDAERAARHVELYQGQVEHLEKVEQLVRQRVSEGRELALEARRAALEVSRARQRAEAAAFDRELAESLLAALLGYGAADRVRPAVEERAAPTLPATAEEAVEAALRDNNEIRRLESALAAKGFQIRAHQASWQPRLNLVAQYGLFARFNNYEDFFRKFQRHNGQIGVSVEIPVLAGSAASAQAVQAEAEAAGLRVELNTARARIANQARRRYHQVRLAQTAREVARLDLEVTREHLGVLLARFEEGREALGAVESARAREGEKWVAYFDAQQALEKARLIVMQSAGGLLAAVL